MGSTRARIWAGLVVAAILSAYFSQHYNGLLFALGLHPYPAGTPWPYQLWSGFVPALAITSLFSGLVAHFKTKNCHVHGCWRLGSYPAGDYTVCKRHHKDVHGHHPTIDSIRHHVTRKHTSHVHFTEASGHAKSCKSTRYNRSC